MNTREKLLELGAIRCTNCADGLRYGPLDCVFCGYGPAPIARPWLPSSEAEKEVALQDLLDGWDRGGLLRHHPPAIH